MGTAIHVNGSTARPPIGPANKPRPARKTAEPRGLADLLRELLKADRQDTKALTAWEREQMRVRDMRPECPAGIEACGVDGRLVQSAEEWVKGEIAARRLQKSSPIVRAFREWKAACQAVDDQNLDRNLARQAQDSRRRLDALDARFRRAPVKSLADLRAKLDYVLNYEHFCDRNCREVVHQLKRDVPNWASICW